jgi:hypothetical protein
MSALKKTFVSLVAPIVGVVISLACVELLIRLLSSRAPSGPGWSDRPVFYFRSPSAPSMQDYPHSPTKPNGTFRIATVGDSFTFAPYMQFTDTYPKKLEAMLNLRDGGRSAEVINYGVPAYSTSHEVPVVATAIDEGADVIVLQITLNDPEVKHHTPTGLRENMEDRFGALKMDGSLGRIAKYWRTLGFILTRLHNSKTHKAYINYFNDLFENPRSWNPFAESMKKIVASAQASKKPLVAVVFPLFGLPMNDRYPFYGIHTKVADLMRSLSVPVLDLSPIYKGIPLERMQVIPGVDRHPNEIAHRMAAERIYLWLEEQHLLPQSALITEKFATRLGTQKQRVWSGELHPES